MESISLEIPPDISAEIQKRIDEIEAQECVRVFYACESGSRAWGFPSADSDFDVRFLYVHPLNWYLSIDDKRDVIEKPVSENLDLSGWDIRKALGLFKKSNPPLMEWLHSPIIYREKYKVTNNIRSLVSLFYSPVNALNHYLHMAQRTYQDYLLGDAVRAKKYFYALRPLLACKWIEKDLGPVPMEFSTMVEAVVDSESLKQEIKNLIERKKTGLELDLEPPIPLFQDFIQTEIERLSATDDSKSAVYPDTKELNQLFLNALDEVWA